jgi:pectin methylesterase-like acyl-CoA thioesterase
MGISMRKVVQIALITVLSTVISGYAVTKKAFDFIVGVNGDFKAAMSAAAKSASSSNRFVIFFPNGQYNIGSLTGDANQMTTFPTAYVSFIGQNKDSVVIYNNSATEGISVTATLYFKGAHSLYMQDLAVQNKGTAGTSANRHVVICEESNNVVYKNVKLLGTQDTYYSKGTKTYWENGEIHGTTDFICGRGDVFFNKCLIWTDKAAPITAPDGSGDYGYVFSNCTINGSVSGFTLGRAWKDKAECVYLNTTMIKEPVATGWADPINELSTMLLAEYNSMNATGGKIDLSKRKTTFVYTKNGTTVTATSSKAVLSASDAAGYSADNIFGSWKPANLTVQQAAPVVSKSGSALKWDDNTDALCWVVFRDGKYFKCVTTPTVDMASGTGIYIVKAANAMGGLGAASNAVSADGTPVLSNNPVSSGLFSVQLTPVNNVVSLSIPSGTIGSTLRILSANGRTVLVKRLDSMMSEIDLSHNAAGSYIFEINRGNPTDIVYSQTVAVR